MLNRLKKTVKLWKLSKKSKGFQEMLETLTDDDIQALPDEDTKAVFLSEGTDAEYDDYVRKEINGWKVFDQKIDKIINRHVE